MSLGCGLKFGGKIMTDEEIATQAELGQDIIAYQPLSGNNQTLGASGVCSGYRRGGSHGVVGMWAGE